VDLEPAPPFETVLPSGYVLGCGRGEVMQQHWMSLGGGGGRCTESCHVHSSCLTNHEAPGITRPEREGGHSPPTRDEINKYWNLTTMPMCAFIAWCLVSPIVIISEFKDMATFCVLKFQDS
jgi:hypothetical protein